MGEATRWAIANAIRADHLADCDVCGEVVHAGDECSPCLEELGVVHHADTCDHDDCQEEDK